MIKYKITDLGLESTAYESHDSTINDTRATVNNNMENIQDVYNPILPQNIDILRGIEDNIRNIEKETIKKQIIKFFNVFKDYYYNILKQENIENILSKLHLSCDTDSCIIEWNFKTFRIGFSFEENEIESSYYLVESNIENGEFVSYSKLLKDTSFYVLIDKILSYVISNT